MTHGSRASLLAVTLLFAALTGCGLETYESRLKATTLLYQHYQVLNENLGPVWESGPITLRVPQQFVEIPAPKPPEAPKEAGAEPPPPPPDTRKPTQPPLELNGLRAAFKADLTVDGGSKQPGFIYVLSNYDFTKDQKDMFGPLTREIANAFHLNIDEKTWKSEQYPERATEAFPGMVYNAANLTPQDVEGPPRRVSIYLNKQGEVETAIVMILPQKLDGSERLADRIPLCLETLNVGVTELIPPPAEGAAPGQAPAVEVPKGGSF